MKLQITINGTAYAVDVEVLEEEEAVDESPRPQPSSPAAAHTPNFGGHWDATKKTCSSPVMGLVVGVHVEQGQSVQAGDNLLVLEAMKMETNIAAPLPGRIKQVHVAKGSSVKLNQILIELE